MFGVVALFATALVALALIGRLRRSSQLHKLDDEVTKVIASIDSQSAKQSVAGHQDLSVLYGLTAQHLRDGLASVLAGRLLYPENTAQQIKVISGFMDDPILLVKVTEGQDELAAARAHFALKALLEKLISLARR